MKAKLIIASPLQLINALEAKNYFEVDNIDIVFFSDGNKNNEKQIALIVERFEINANILLIRKPQQGNFFKRFFFLRSLKSYKTETNNYNYIIIGHFRSIYQVTFANLYVGTKIFVDDGTRTLDDISFLNKRGYKTIEYLIKKSFYDIFSIKPYAIAKHYTFFSYYAKKVEVDDHISLIQNDFSFIKRKRMKKDAKTNKKIAFVGQSLVDTKLVTLNCYLELINGIDKYYRKEYCDLVKIEYYAHRNESDEVLKFIKRMPNWVIKKNDLPLELHFLLSDEFPIEIGLFFSSVSETLSIVFENKFKLRSFLISPKYLSYRKSEIAELFEGYRISKNIQLVENYID